MTVTGRGLLTVMAFDRYAAICNPLRYTAIMTRKVRMLLICEAWGFGMGCTLPTISAVLRVLGSSLNSGPNRVRHCFCFCFLLRYAAGVRQHHRQQPPVVALLTMLALILSSYAAIGASICRMGSWEVRRKAFATCAAHLTVISISYGSTAFVYTSYRVGNFSPDVRIVVATLYSALTPLLNPVIYSLRNKELRDTVRRTFCRQRVVSPQARKTVATVA
ncbi:hypothetical protein SKAU_G00326440 [Synaphobranchus kaupii]|uniref:G-protein coupled receptors family 1 profile domain-containing protein n=1 Tax=Synaphobranchus kaupii TaxID=118154 RepID=A0A9Q1EPP1_SYNKA|nr:hypothetical protein SKAU_G00326440 [Synaphobranchus kaupii]